MNSSSKAKRQAMENRSLVSEIRDMFDCSWCHSHEELQWHHIGTKKFLLARCGSHSTERILDEVSKCIVLCKTCHVAYHEGVKKNKELMQCV